MVPFFFLPYQLFMYRVTKVHVYVHQQMAMLLNRGVPMLWIQVVGFFRFQSWAHTQLSWRGKAFLLPHTGRARACCPHCPLDIDPEGKCKCCSRF